MKQLLRVLLVLTASTLTAHAENSATRADGPEDSGERGRPAPTAKNDGAGEAMCLLIESAALANGLPLEFFARVIWQESRFRPDAIGPVTRSGERAQGIAQFMPGTAADRNLLDPFDPVQALPKSAEFLRDLRKEFGNLGLAAAAYNAGPQRVRDWLAGGGFMPSETRHYVYAITGASVDEWAESADGKAPASSAGGCRQLMALLRRVPNPFVAELEKRVVAVAARPWGVQLSAGFSRAGALAAYARVEKRYGAIIADKDPMILAARLRSRGTRTFYQVRVGAETRALADRLCGSIRRAGGACMVLRNPHGRR